METRVMVVDDDAAIVDLIGDLLQSEGYQVETFASAILALEAARSDPPDAIIADLMMPDLDGRDLIQALRLDPDTYDVPVLLCSAYYGDLRRCLLQLGDGNVSYLRKPFHIDDLVDRVAQLTSGLRSGSERVGRTAVGEGSTASLKVA